MIKFTEKKTPKALSTINQTNPKTTTKNPKQTNKKTPQNKPPNQKKSKLLGRSRTIKKINNISLKFLLFDVYTVFIMKENMISSNFLVTPVTA